MLFGSEPRKCAEETDFLALSSAQLSRILQREDLKVSREEVVP